MAYLDYDMLSRCYDELYGEEQRDKYRAVVNLIGCGSSDVLLDAGCGTSLLLDYLRNVGFRYKLYVGLDKSIGMLKVAKSRLDSLSNLIQADIHRLPIRDKACDVTLSVTVIHHLNHDEALKEFKRVTRRMILVTQHRRLDGRRFEGRLVETSRENIYVINP